MGWQATIEIVARTGATAGFIQQHRVDIRRSRPSTIRQPPQAAAGRKRRTAGRT
jgi:hypothetical protein